MAKSLPEALMPQMLQWFRGHNGDTKLSDAQLLFSRFRSKGVRLHYWP